MYLEKFCLHITFVFQFLCVANYMKCIYERTTHSEMSTGSLLRPKILGN